MSVTTETVKVIHMAHLGSGGISNLTVTINELISENIKFDYLVFRNKKEFLEDKAVSLGGKKQVIDVENIKNDFLKFFIKMRAMVALFKREGYDVVHVDASTPYDVMVAVAAKIAGIPTIVMHSHNDDFHGKKPLRDALIPFYKVLMKAVVTDYFTISEKSAKFMFPKSIYEEKKYTLVKNGIDVEKYTFNENIRSKIREELGVQDKVVVGHVGRFVYQKNHDFILEAFAEFHKRCANSVLLLIGEGVLLSKMQEKAKNIGIADAVIFYGVTYDIPGMLQAMDMFIFPSRFEGLGIVAIESQAAGLPTLCADTIVDEVNITSKFVRVHGWNPSDWADKMNALLLDRDNRTDCKEEVIKAGYDIRTTVKQLEIFYTESISRKRKSSNGKINTTET